MEDLSPKPVPNRSNLVIGCRVDPRQLTGRVFRFTVTILTDGD